MAGVPPAAPPGFTDHTFKLACGTELAVRVWPAETSVNKPAPFVIWYVDTHVIILVGTESFSEFRSFLF
jgi:hypothetical protein